MSAKEEVLTITRDALNEMIRERVEMEVASRAELFELDMQVFCTILQDDADNLRSDAELDEVECASIADYIEEAIRRLEKTVKP